MRIVQLQAENFKILRTVEINPDGNVVTIGGKNGQGKSSILDAVWVALAGRAVAPPQPIRNGEQKCVIRLDLGDIIITRTLNAKEGGYTDSVKVESGDGRQRFNSPQGMLNDLLGQIGFDPLAFVQKKPDDQAATLLEMVPLPLDLEELARKDTADYADRRDINRDAASLKAQIDAIAVRDDLPEDAPDREELVAKLGNASDHNLGIERERTRRAGLLQRRDIILSDSERAAESAKELRARAAALIEEAKGREADAESGCAEVEKMKAEYDALPELETPIDTDAVRAELTAAEAILSALDRQKARAEMLTRHGKMVTDAQALTDMMAAREEDRRKALAGAKMPIDGLAFAVNDKGKPVVMFNGVPFEQASSADQIKASTAIAMASNPELRVLRIKDGSLLDEDSMAIIAGMAKAEDFQLWIEVVGTGGVGIVIENGSIKGPDQVEEKPKANDKPQGGLL